MSGRWFLDSKTEVMHYFIHGWSLCGRVFNARLDWSRHGLHCKTCESKLGKNNLSTPKADRVHSLECDYCEGTLTRFECIARQAANNLAEAVSREQEYERGRT